MSSHYSAEFDKSIGASDVSRDVPHSNKKEDVAEYQKLLKQQQADIDYSPNFEEYTEINDLYNEIFSSVSSPNTGSAPKKSAEPDSRHLRNTLLQRASKQQPASQETGNAAVNSRREAAKGPL